MSQTSTVQVQEVSEKSGVSQNTGRPWKKWALQDTDGNWYGTFEAGVVLASMKGTTVEIDWEQNGNFRNLLRAVPTGLPPGGTITPVTPQATFQAPPGVGVDWDRIGLQKTRCALWAAYLTEALPAAFGYWVSVQSQEPGTADIVHFLNRVGRDLVIAAEVDIFHRDPAVKDEEIPF